LKAYTVFTLGVRKNQYFQNKSGKEQLIRTKFGIRGQVRGWQRSWNFGHDQLILGKMGGCDESRGAQVFLCGNPYDLLATLQRLIFTKFGHET